MALYISNPSKTAEILKQHNIKLKKSLGQNFLIDTNVAKKIVRFSCISSKETVLEIGSGIGSMTQLLLDAACRIVCVEIDRKLAAIFKELFSEYIGTKIVLVEADAMKFDYLEFTENYNISRVISNLPYKIAASVILEILVAAPGVKSMYLTVQKDIADRICAKKGDKIYSSYSVKANFLADFKVLFDIPRTCFIPVPFVGSSFVEVLRKGTGLIPGKYTGDKYFRQKKLQDPEKYQQKEFFDFIDACFLHRRKMLLNSLLESNYLKMNKVFRDAARIDKIDLIAKMLRVIGKDRNIRAEELELNDFMNLFISLKQPVNL